VDLKKISTIVQKRSERGDEENEEDENNEDQQGSKKRQKKGGSKKRKKNSDPDVADSPAQEEQQVNYWELFKETRFDKEMFKRRRKSPNEVVQSRYHV
jgi:hypothetical protein